MSNEDQVTKQEKCPYCGIFCTLADYGGEYRECDRCAYAARLAQPASDREAVDPILRNVVSHATGGGIDLAETPMSMNDICVAISKFRNVVYQAGKDAGAALILSNPS